MKDPIIIPIEKIDEEWIGSNGKKRGRENAWKGNESVGNRWRENSWNDWGGVDMEWAL